MKSIGASNLGWLNFGQVGLNLLNPPGRVKRWSIKIVFVLAIATLVLYPRPWMLVRHVQRVLDLPGLVEPDAPGIAGLAERVRQQGGETADPAAKLRAVEEIVLKTLPYEYDWDNWGVANYFPKAGEAIQRGRCDCKGRAVVAASILARLGFTPRLVSDLSHVWVWTPEGEALGARRTASGHLIIDANAAGERVDWRAVVSSGGLLIDLPSRVGFSINVFPPLRTGIIALSVWIAVLPMMPRRVGAVLGLLGLGAGVVVLGWSSPDPDRANVLAAWIGIALIAGGLRVSALRSRVRTGHEKTRQPEAAGL